MIWKYPVIESNGRTNTENIIKIHQTLNWLPRQQMTFDLPDLSSVGRVRVRHLVEEFLAIEDTNRLEQMSQGWGIWPRILTVMRVKLHRITYSAMTIIFAFQFNKCKINYNCTVSITKVYQKICQVFVYYKIMVILISCDTQPLEVLLGKACEKQIQCIIK